MGLVLEDVGVCRVVGWLAGRVEGRLAGRVVGALVPFLCAFTARYTAGLRSVIVTRSGPAARFVQNASFPVSAPFEKVAVVVLTAFLKEEKGSLYARQRAFAGRTISELTNATFCDSALRTCTRIDNIIG
tara:strand:- start:11164 stop:11553 length:390 start_codon:yes stop_codon:yes gene_type:complete